MSVKILAGFIFMAFWLAGCTNPFSWAMPDLQTGVTRPLDVWQQPLCLFACSAQLGAAGSNIEGGGSNTQSQTQSAAQTGGGIAITEGY